MCRILNELYALLHSYLLSDLTDVSQSCVGTRVLLEYLIAMMLFEAIQVFTELFKTMVTVNGVDDSIFQGEFADMGTNFSWYFTFMEITTPPEYVQLESQSMLATYK